jgi:hypothetical protein
VLLAIFTDRIFVDVQGFLRDEVLWDKSFVHLGLPGLPAALIAQLARLFPILFRGSVLAPMAREMMVTFLTTGAAYVQTCLIVSHMHLGVEAGVCRKALSFKACAYVVPLLSTEST